MYLASGLHNGRPYYYNRLLPLYLRYLPTSGWTVGSTLASSDYLAFNSEDVATPDLISSTSWTVWDGSSDVTDSGVQALCTGFFVDFLFGFAVIYATSIRQSLSPASSPIRQRRMLVAFTLWVCVCAFRVLCFA